MPARATDPTLFCRHCDRPILEDDIFGWIHRISGWRCPDGDTLAAPPESELELTRPPRVRRHRF